MTTVPFVLQPVDISLNNEACLLTNSVTSYHSHCTDQPISSCVPFISHPHVDQENKNYVSNTNKSIFKGEEVFALCNLKKPVVKLHKLPSAVFKYKTVIVTSENKILFPLENGGAGNNDYPLKEEAIEQCFKESVPKHVTSALHFPHSYNTNGFYNNQHVATSFFLHMNRYRPEESCFYTSPHTPPNLTKLSHILTESTFPLLYQPDATKKSQVPKKTAFPRQSTDSRNVAESRTVNKGHKWACEYCNKTFKYRWNFRTHLQLHTGVKPYACQFCQQRFHQKCHLVKHIAGHHPFKADNQSTTLITVTQGIPRNTNFSCGFCGSSFEKGKTYLERHILSNHNDNLVKSPANG